MQDGPRARPDPAEQFRARLSPGCRTVVLVEGVSDQVAVETLAARFGRDLHREGIQVLAMGGVTNLAHALRVVGPAGRRLRVRGLCDAGEVGHVRRALRNAGLGCLRSDEDDLDACGFFVCTTDLEDELIRAVGIDGVERVVAGDGALASFRILQSQPAQRDRTPTDQFRRFISGRAGHKVRYARLLVDALDLDRAPEPLLRLLARLDVP